MRMPTVSPIRKKTEFHVKTFVVVVNLQTIKIIVEYNVLLFLDIKKKLIIIVSKLIQVN